jgi:hypothetical protein
MIRVPKGTVWRYSDCRFCRTTGVRGDWGRWKWAHERQSLSGKDSQQPQAKGQARSVGGLCLAGAGAGGDDPLSIDGPRLRCGGDPPTSSVGIFICSLMKSVRLQEGSLHAVGTPLAFDIEVRLLDGGRTGDVEQSSKRWSPTTRSGGHGLTVNVESGGIFPAVPPVTSVQPPAKKGDESLGWGGTTHRLAMPRVGR